MGTLKPEIDGSDNRRITVGVPPGMVLEYPALRVRSPKMTLSCRTLIF